MFEMPEGEETELLVTREYAEDKLNKSTISKLKAVS
jgi:ATP-dependent Clp protease ATP-binding subunit ClpX